MSAAESVVATKIASTVEKVAMEDGREVEFAGKRKVLKDAIIDNVHGTVAVRFDLRNGVTRTYPLRPDMILQFAGHGAEQKYGDELAGEEGDLDDFVLVLDRL